MYVLGIYFNMIIYTDAIMKRDLQKFGTWYNKNAFWTPEILFQFLY